jgi:hypothetical protein
VGVGEGEQRLSVSAASMASITKSKGGQEGESVGRCMMRGNKGGTDGASLPLPWSMGGRPMAARGAVVPAKSKAAWATEVGEDLWVGQSGLRRPMQGFWAGRGRMVQRAELGQKGRTDWALWWASR